MSDFDATTVADQFEAAIDQQDWKNAEIARLNLKRALDADVPLTSPERDRFVHLIDRYAVEGWGMKPAHRP